MFEFYYNVYVTSLLSVVSPINATCYTVFMSEFIPEQPHQTKMPSTLTDAPAAVQQRLERRLRGWAQGLHKTGLSDVVGAMLEAVGPVSLLGAQVLWVAQPTLSIFMPADEVGGLAHLLENEQGLAWLRSIIIDADAQVMLTDSADYTTEKGG